MLLLFCCPVAAAQKRGAPVPPPLPEIQLPEVDLPSDTTRVAYPIELPPQPVDPYRRAGGCHEIRSWGAGGHNYSFDIPPRVRNYTVFRDSLFAQAARVGATPPVHPVRVHLFITSDGAVANHLLRGSSGSTAWDQLVLSTLPMLQFHPPRKNVGGAVSIWVCRTVELSG